MDWPSPFGDSLGAASVFAVLLSLVLGSLGESSLLKKRFERHRRALIPPLVLLGILGYLKISVDSSAIGLGYNWHISRYATTDDLFAGYILVAFSTVLAWRSVCVIRGAIRILALAELLIAAGFLSLEFFYTFDFLRGWS